MIKQKYTDKLHCFVYMHYLKELFTIGYNLLWMKNKRVCGTEEIAMIRFLHFRLIHTKDSKKFLRLTTINICKKNYILQI